MASATLVASGRGTHITAPKDSVILLGHVINLHLFLFEYVYYHSSIIVLFPTRDL